MKNLRLTLTISLVLFCSNVLFSGTPIKLNLTNGKTYWLKNVTHQKIHQQVGGNQMSFDLDNKSSISIKQLNRKDDTLTLEVRFDTICLNINTPMFKKDLNSAVIAKKDEYLEQLMNRYSKTSFIVKFTALGKYISCENYKAFKADIKTAIDSIPAAQKDMTKNLANNFLPLKEEKFQNALEPMFMYIPEKEVAVNESWETPLVQSGILISNTFTLVSVEKNDANISGKSVIEDIPTNDGAQPNDKETKGTSTSEFIININTGLPIKEHIKMNITMKSSKGEGNTEFDTTITTIE
jgi:hypothetical protein